MINDKDRFKEIFKNVEVFKLMFKISDNFEDKEYISKLEELNKFFLNEEADLSIEDLEKEMQTIMDEYAGGISKYYRYSKESLTIAKTKIKELFEKVNRLKANDLHELLFIYEIIDRLQVSEVLIEHLLTREETGWKCYEENIDFPERDDYNWFKYVNSVYKDGAIKIILRDIIGKDENYEHKNS